MYLKVVFLPFFQPTYDDEEEEDPKEVCTWFCVDDRNVQTCTMAMFVCLCVCVGGGGYVCLYV